MEHQISHFNRVFYIVTKTKQKKNPSTLDVGTSASRRAIASPKGYTVVILMKAFRKLFSIDSIKDGLAILCTTQSSL